MTENIAACDHRVVNEGDKRRVIMECKGCDESYDSRDCLPSIILAMQDEYDIDDLILAGHVENKYGETGLGMLKAMRELSEKLDRFSTRIPKGDDCEGCDLNPGQLYPDIKSALIGGKKEVFQIYMRGAKTLMKKAGCDRCRKAAKEELGIVGEELLELKETVLLEAYGVLSE